MAQNGESIAADIKHIPENIPAICDNKLDFIILNFYKGKINISAFKQINI
jgi:hypothetical protein